jgi:hypothetical protein
MTATMLAPLVQALNSDQLQVEELEVFKVDWLVGWYTHIRLSD